jgi:putative peptide zinc metalloprotease protein
VFLTASLIIGHSQRAEIAHLGQQLWQHQGSGLIIPFGLTTAAVVTLHELGHAFTLKHFGGIVPEIGLLLMCLFPAAYTNSSDAYILPRWQKSLVIGGGILVQLILGAIGLLFWNLSHSGTWLHTGSYLLLCASLLTVAINLNPLARLDGYYLAMALTGINNLRSRAFGFYRDLFTGKPSSEPEHTRPILLLYAPLSLVYIWFVFGFLFLRIFTWCLDTIPVTAGLLLAIWAVYYFFFPEPQST